MNSAMRRQVEKAQRRDTVQNIIVEVIGWSVTGLLAIIGAFSWNDNELHGDEHLLDDADEYPPVEQWEIDEALADIKADLQWMEENT